MDAFTDAPFAGNPAAVCFAAEVGDKNLFDLQALAESTMKAIAAEMNLSETAFVTPQNGDFSTATAFHLRWFTPTCEVPLCGHATLASAKAIFDAAGEKNSIHAHGLLSYDTIITIRELVALPHLCHA